MLPNPFATEPSTWELPALFAGQPISVMLTITTSFHWAPLEDADIESYLLRYDIEEVTKDWLVSGRKRGDFIATVSLLLVLRSFRILMHPPGWCNLHNACYLDCPAPWRVVPSQNRSQCSSTYRRTADEITRCAELRDLSGAWCRDCNCFASRG